MKINSNKVWNFIEELFDSFIIGFVLCVLLFFIVLLVLAAIYVPTILLKCIGGLIVFALVSYFINKLLIIKKIKRNI